MKARTKFLKWYYKMPVHMRRSLVWRPFDKPMSMDAVAFEVINKTKLGSSLLLEMGWEDDETD